MKRDRIEKRGQLTVFCFADPEKKWTIKYNPFTQLFLIKSPAGKEYNLLFQEFIYGSAVYNEAVEYLPRYVHNAVCKINKHDKERKEV